LWMCVCSPSLKPMMANRLTKMAAITRIVFAPKK
jgi:hypothetical protein